MSLDVYLKLKCEDAGDGDEHWLTLYEANYTHNCNSMAAEAGVYKCLWHPDEIGFERAEQLIDPLQAGIKTMQADPDRFKALNPKNGWGSYETFLPWCLEYLAACQKYPKARITVSR